MTRKSLCVIKSEILVRMRGNMPQGTKMHFRCPAREGSKFFKTIHTNQISEGRPMSVWQLQCLTCCSTPEIGIDFQYPKIAGFRRSTSLGDVIDVTAAVNHMLYFVLAT